MINIIGAGPAGLLTATELSKAGKSVNIFEEHITIGEPVQCTGITTSHLNNIIKLPGNIIINTLDKAKVKSKNNEIIFSLKHENIILDRKLFDQHLEKLAKKENVNIFKNHKFLEYKKDYIIIKDLKNNKTKQVKNTILIGADGPQSKVSKIINKKNNQFLIGAQARVKINTNPNVFETELGDIAKGFFTWLVPENKNIARIGLATNKNLNQNFKKLLSTYNIDKNQIIDYQGGLIPLYNPNQKIKHNNIYLVGDAASQIKATTGGGIIPALNSAKLLAESIINKKDYQEQFNKILKKDLYTSLMIRKTLDKFKDKDFDYLIKLCKQKKIKNLIEEFDREYPSRYMLKILLKEPRFILFSRFLL